MKKLAKKPVTWRPDSEKWWQCWTDTARRWAPNHREKSVSCSEDAEAQMDNFTSMEKWRKITLDVTKIYFFWTNKTE